MLECNFERPDSHVYLPFVMCKMLEFNSEVPKSLFSYFLIVKMLETYYEVPDTLFSHFAVCENAWIQFWESWCSFFSLFCMWLCLKRILRFLILFFLTLLFVKMLEFNFEVLHTLFSHFFGCENAWIQLWGSWYSFFPLCCLWKCLNSILRVLVLFFLTLNSILRVLTLFFLTLLFMKMLEFNFEVPDALFSHFAVCENA